MKIQKGCDTKYLRKVLKSLKLSFVPAGDMVKVDQQKEMNHCHAVLVNIVNLLVGL